MYGLGAGFGRERLYAIWERVPLVKTEDLERTELWIERHGRKAVFLGRMVPIFRSLVSVPAGLSRMSPVVFLLLTLAGSLVWNSVFVLAGYLLGEQWHRVEGYVGGAQSIVVVLVVLGVSWFGVNRVRSLWSARRGR